MNNKFKAFTLIEILFTVAIISISIGLTSAWTISGLNRSRHQTSAESLVSLLRTIRTASDARANNNSHGIHLTSTQYTSFEGTSYDNSIQETRQQFELPPTIEIKNISLNGEGSDIIFKENSGWTDQYGSFDIIHTPSDDSFTISISPLGLIDWQ